MKFDKLIEAVNDKSREEAILTDFTLILQDFHQHL